MSLVIFTVSYVLDWLIGDPEWLPHPVRWMGAMIKAGESRLRRARLPAGAQFLGGMVLTIGLVGIVGAGSWLLLSWLRHINGPAFFLVSVCLGAATLATRSLINEAKKVSMLLEVGDLSMARVQVARIVGRDPQDLDESEITRATIETLAESASDGIVAPLLYFAIGGVPIALTYKAINTLDSMIGHHDERYEYFGKLAARLDDIANYVPARITALLLVLTAWLMGLDAISSWRVLWRDGGKHKSPNAGRPEAAMAGALGVRLGGTNFYDGVRHDGQYLGDPINPLGDGALRDALRLTIVVSVLMFLTCLVPQLSLRLFEALHAK